MCFGAIYANAQHTIIPAPVSYESKEGMFMLDNQTSIDLKANNPELKKMTENFPGFSQKCWAKHQHKSSTKS